jgi:hypothetical protein
VGIISYDLLDRSALLVCDRCERVLLTDGSISDRAQRDSSPDQLALHSRSGEELTRSAKRAGWRATQAQGHSRRSWICPSCEAATHRETRTA